MILLVLRVLCGILYSIIHVYLTCIKCLIRKSFMAEVLLYRVEKIGSEHANCKLAIVHKATAIPEKAKQIRVTQAKLAYRL